MDRPAFQPLAEIEIDGVSPAPHGFTLTGQSPDRAEYRLDVRFEIPLDPRTRSVLAELLSQADLTIARRSPQPTPAPSVPAGSPDGTSPPRRGRARANS